MQTGIAILLAVAAMAGAIGGPLLSVYLSRQRRGIDKATETDITERVNKAQDERNFWRYERMLQLEEYADLDQHWHRAITEILREARERGFISKDRIIPDPPVLPKLPPHATTS